MVNQKSTLGSDASTRIKLSRSICIFFVMFVHLYTGYSHDQIAELPDSYFKFVHFIFSDVLGRSSVPLLSIISGYLTYTGFRNYYPTILKKFSTLIVPLILWNSIMLSLLTMHAIASHDYGELPKNIPEYATALTAMLAQPANEPLGFLRDLFVCMLFFPAVIWLCNRAPLVLIALTATMTIMNLGAPILLRPQILLFLSIGCIIASTRSLDIVNRFTVIAAPIALVMIVVKALDLHDGEHYARLIDNALRISFAGSIWHVTGVIAQTKWSGHIAKMEPASFFAFCSHMILFKVASVVLAPLFGKFGSTWYPIYFFIQPPMAFLLAYQCCSMFGSNRMFNVVNGSRSRARLAPASTPALA